MKPFDPRLVRDVPETRVPVVALGVLGGLSGVAAISGAFAIAALVVAVVRAQSLFGPALAVAIVFAVRGLLSLITEQVASWAATRISGALRRDYLARALSSTADERPDTAAVMTVATHGASSVEPYVARYLPALIAAGVVPPLAVLCLFFVDWSSAVIVILTLPLLPLFAALIGKYTQAATERRWNTQTRLAGHFLDVMRGLPTLVSYGRAHRQADQVDEVGNRHRLATVGTLRIAFMSSAALELLATISVAIVAVWTGMRLAWDELDLGIALTAILLAPEAYWPVRRVGQEFHAAADGVEAIDALLPKPPAEQESSVVEQGRPVVEQGRGVSRGVSVETPEQLTKTLAAERVSYRYPGSDRDVLQGVSLHVAEGLTVIAGPSGCGKTTLLELLAGLRTPTSGTITRPSTHLVSQMPFIAPMTVRDNLLLGAPAARGSSDALANAMATTGFDQVVATLPLGLDTPLGDEGFGLSAGQRARLVLTRAWLSEAEVVLLDEPTAHLDPLAAQEVRDTIAALAARRTVVVVSHDDALVERAGRVFTDFAQAVAR
ncbi:thiol reductant ABC exporter subunit CydD [Yimella sp. cx-51]|uniref:thiol reductant ABC exporter subunit CydD n=1 Tax=Yimella sp. cx-51 TaxID=2770551 RepID=UPI00165D9F10|nr:thiol reductant ABC exporter subunit CydD [Yimella sp. cx-51]MBC9957899.1 thiol reductant ABC exporter subunit CydD [Yimella sp. cx-51]QTH38034.1 thiol reductant ABC exporter subunit CydD [Yimella sp. cx-51]